jgi:hypothetical protein
VRSAFGRQADQLSLNGTDFPRFQFLVYDEAEDRLLAHDNTIPLD